MRGGRSPFTWIRRSRWVHPTRLIVLVYLAVVAAGTLLLALPWATPGGAPAAPVTSALFTASSAVTVTGLTVVDTAEAWSRFGQVVILGLIQLGGFGITTFASVFAVLVFRRLGLRARMLAQLESKQVQLGDLRPLIYRIALFYVVGQAVGVLVLSGVLVVRGSEGAGGALWNGTFHAVSAFNNAGFSTFPTDLEALAGAVTFLVPVMALVTIGGIGFPVVLEVMRSPRRPRGWSLHVKLTLAVSVSLVVLGAVAIGAMEWGNPATLGALGPGDRVLNAVFSGVTPRTAGFATYDYAEAGAATQVFTMALMFIGGGSASAAGGIKVTTFALLVYVVLAELRSDRDVNVFSRRISEATQRQAVTVALLGVGSVVVGALVIALTSSGFGLGAIIFEAVSAVGTVGLSLGVTPSLDGVGQVGVSALMLLGRLGPLTLGTAIALRRRPVEIRYPEGRPLIG